MATPAGRTQGIHAAAGFQTEKGLGQIIGIGKVSIDLPSIAAISEGVGTATITGAKTTDVVIIMPPSNLSVTDLVLVGARISVADTVEVKMLNHHATLARDAAAADFAFVLIRFD